MSKYERINVAIPVNNKWNLSDLEKRAEELGLDRNEFVLKAVDMMMNFDNDFLNYIKHYADGLKIPEYLVIQNMIIKIMADKEAKTEVYGAHSEILDEFINVVDNKGARTLTGNELKKILKDRDLREYKKELKEIEERKDFNFKGQQKLD